MTFLYHHWRKPSSVITMLLLVFFYLVKRKGNLMEPIVDLKVKVSAARPEEIVDVPKLVLYWNTFFGHDDFLFGFGQQPFINAGCKVNTCAATNDRNLFNQTHGVIIHAGNYEENDLPTYRLPHQRFIFFNLETLPDGMRLPCFSRAHFYNWTMSHRRDSDVYLGIPYGRLKRRENSIINHQLPPKLKPGQRSPKPELLLTHKHDPSKNRTKLMAWYNSHCSTHSRREDYVRKLAQYIPIDIYGKCGQLECLPRLGTRCDVLLESYKFYLALENSLCPDYISEKFYRALISNVVPVVYGGADYTQYAPVNSYINVADFRSPKELSEYLLLLDNNDALYHEYFKWKKNYEVIRHPADGWCELCEKLNDPTLEKKSYKHLAKWWYNDVPCLTGLSYLQSVIS